jgi:hypothetical protein
MVTLGLMHYVYLIMTLLILTILLMKKEIVLPCILGILLMGLAASGSVVTAVQVLYNALVSAGIEFLTIIVVIGIVVAMSKSLTSIGADELMIRPLKKVIKTKKVAFFVVGAVMLVVSWFVWPSPAVALVGALLLPIALKAKLPNIWCAVAMNLFGHGVGLSSDFVIQGAPGITAKAAGLDTMSVITASIPLWATMSFVTILVSWLMFVREDRARAASTAVSDISEGEDHWDAGGEIADGKTYTPFARIMAILTPALFAADVVLMLILGLKGGDATALVGGTAILVLALVTIFRGNFFASLETIADDIKEGFQFAIRIFAPVIVIAGFFFLGSGDIAAKILGEGAPSILNDFGLYLSQRVRLDGGLVAVVQSLVGIVTGLDGSGFSGLPLLGSLARTFSTATGANAATLAALGQITTVWVDGGTIIPWAVIPVAAICNVKPGDLARKNLIPVAVGLVAMLAVAILIL